MMQRCFNENNYLLILILILILILMFLGSENKNISHLQRLFSILILWGYKV